MNTLKRLHTKECPYMCLLCFKSFHTLRLLKKHFNQHEQEAKKAALEENVPSDKETNGINEDEENMKTSTRSETIISKSVSEIPPGVIGCDVCGKTFKFRYMLVRHSLCHLEGHPLSQSQGPYQCECCDIKLSSKRKYWKHIVTHKNGSSKPSVDGSSNQTVRPLCDICGKSFINRKILTWHKQFHLPPGNFPCKLCGKVFDLKVKLRIHMRYHRLKIREGKKLMEHESHPCEICGKVFYLIRALKNHRRLHKESYECHLCGRIFNKKTNLKTHMNIHEGKKPLSCSHCGASYADRSNLLKHLSKHPPDVGAKIVSTIPE